MSILTNIYSRIKLLANKKPSVTFFIGLVLLFLVILISSFFRNEKKDIAAPEMAVKTVSTYTVGESPKVKYIAEIEKNNLLTVYALTGGVITSLNYTEGENVPAYSTLATISNNYLGANTSTNQRRISDLQYSNAKDSYQQNIDIINNQRELAKNNDENSQNLAEISRQSFDSTRELIDLNQTIVDSIDATIEELKDSNVGGSNDSAILAQQQLLSSYKSALNTLQSTFRNSKYVNSEDSKIQDISQDQKEVTLAQLDLQEKSLQLNLEVLELQNKISKITESLSYPSLPFDTTIQSVEVKEGAIISSGMPLYKVSTQNDVIQAKVYVTKYIAEKITLLSDSTLQLGNDFYDLAPSFISSEPVKGSMYLVIYNLPADLSGKTYDSQTIYVQIPLEQKVTSSNFPFVPIDSIYQTSQSSYVYVVDSGKAKSIEVGLGKVYGSYVEITTDLSDNSQIILDRDVVNGQLVKVKE